MHPSPGLILTLLALASAPLLHAQSIPIDLLSEARDGKPGDLWVLPTPGHLAALQASIAMMDTPEDGRFLRVRNATPNASVSTDAILEIPPGRTRVILSVAMRTPEITPSPERTWANDARVALFFDLPDKTRRSATNAATLASERQRWRTFRLLEPIPEGATNLIVSLGLFNAVGTADFRSLSVTFE